jgi:hypothetical protein
MHGGRDGHGVPFRDLGEMRRRRNRMVDILERIHNEFSRWYQNREYVKVGTAWDLVREVMRLAAQAGR